MLALLWERHHSLNWTILGKKTCPRTSKKQLDRFNLFTYNVIWFKIAFCTCIIHGPISLCSCYAIRRVTANPCGGTSDDGQKVLRDPSSPRPRSAEARPSEQKMVYPKEAPNRRPNNGKQNTSASTPNSGILNVYQKKLKGTKTIFFKKNC